MAFDPGRGRLWVVCPRCNRWNLSAIEERWEALEECEKAFRDTVLRVSTEHIGLARLREGLDLIRIGEPLRPEFAAWRYGREFRRRRTGALVAGLSVGAGITGFALVSPLIATLSLAWPVYSLAMHRNTGLRTATPRRIVSNMGDTLEISPLDWGRPRLRPGGAREGAWQLQIEHGPYMPPKPDPATLDLPLPMQRRRISERRSAILTGREAEQALAILLPHLNPLGARARHIRTAVGAIEQSRGPDRYFAVAEGYARSNGIAENSVGFLPLPVRLALEIAANEESERRAMQGELDLLERAWRDAEEIAALADNLLVAGTARSER